MVTWRFYFWCFFLCFVSGFVGCYLSAEGWEILPGIIICISVAVWVALDSQTRDIKLTRLFAFGVLLFWIVFLPAYLIDSRRAKGFVATFAAFGVILIGILLAELGAMIVYYVKPENYPSVW